MLRGAPAELECASIEPGRAMALDPPIVLHIIVIGFHHKKGCQVEFSYPPLMPDTGDGTERCPAGWKYLPTLGLPDGSHNFLDDSVFFNLPSLLDPNQTVFGVSCYRQIPVQKLVNVTADVTRSTVQKSVCVLASIPVYGYIEVKLSLIAHAYFKQGDFERTDILVNAYDQLNSCIVVNLEDSARLNDIFVGLPLREIILRWRYKTLILFKLMLLQNRVVYFGSPVRPICSLILSIASLHPQLLESGLGQSACIRTSRPMSPMPSFHKSHSIDSNHTSPSSEPKTNGLASAASEQDSSDEDLIYSKSEDNGNKSENGEPYTHNDADNNVATKAVGRRTSELKSSLSRDTSVDVLTNRLHPYFSFDADEWGAPMQIFTQGNLCLPYLSLPYMDLLTDSSVQGYTIGTSNILFQQKRNLADVFVDVKEATFDAVNLDVRKHLQLSTEDLRFVDFICQHVQAPREGAEGSEQWIRCQFQAYMLSMLRTSLLPDGAKELDQFNESFMTQWKKTSGYREWSERGFRERLEAELFGGVGHPFAGTLSVADVKLKIAQTMSNSESGRKLNQAVNTTSKAVGGALSQAKGAFSSFWSSMTTTPPAAKEPADDNATVPAPNAAGDSSFEILHVPPVEHSIKPDTRSTETQPEHSGSRPASGVVEIGHEAATVLDTTERAADDKTFIV